MVNAEALHSGDARLLGQLRAALDRVSNDVLIAEDAQQSVCLAA